MLPNKDRIARSAQGRFFPVTVAETLALIRELRFASSPYRKRIDVIFQNPDTDSKLGSYVAGFYPADAVVICSFQEEFTQLRASTLVRAALQSFSAIDKGTQPDWNRRQVTLFWAYVGTLNRLTITKRVRTATLTKYRGSAKFSHAFKPKGVRTSERVLHSIEVT